MPDPATCYQGRDPVLSLLFVQAQAAGEPCARLKLRSWSGHSQQVTEKHGLGWALPQKAHQEPIQLLKNSHRVFTREVKLVKPVLVVVSSYTSALQRSFKIWFGAQHRIYNVLTARKHRASCLSLTSISVGWLASLDKETTQRQVTSQTSAVD